MSDHRGLPHTLEHLIFCGSKGHPERGLLDRLSTQCLAQGTNAYTSDDHTCYTAQTASLEGMLQLLPVYLDHLLRPLIDAQTFAKEVFELQESEARGVVYSEMRSREWSEADQLDLALRHHGYTEPHLNTYRWECGGRTARICQLQREEIVAYHRQHYEPGKLIIIISGLDLIERGESKVLADIARVSAHFEASDSDAEIKAVSEEAVPLVAKFPADDESLGSVGLAWPGPASGDLKTIHALQCLLKALRDTAASPLAQRLIERANPIATEIDADVRLGLQTLITMIISGVRTKGSEEVCDEEVCDEAGEELEGEVGDEAEESDVEESALDWLGEGCVKGEVASVLAEVAALPDDALMKMISASLSSLQNRWREQVEEDVHEVVMGSLVPEALLHHYTVASVQPLGKGLETTMQIIFDDLAKEDASYWRHLLQHWLNPDRAVEARMIPNRAEGELVRQREVEQLQKAPKSQTAEESFVKGIDCTKQNVVMPAYYNSISHDYPSPKLIAANHLMLPQRISQFNQVLIALPIVSVNPSLWPYLVILQELFFQTNLPEMGYRDLLLQLQTQLSHWECSVGFANEIFTVGHLSTHFILQATSSQLCANSLADLLWNVACNSILSDEERVTVIIDGLLNQLAEAKRDPSMLMETLFQQLANQNLTAKRSRQVNVDAAISIVQQAELLNAAKQDIPQTVVYLEELRSALVSQRNAALLFTSTKEASAEEPSTVSMFQQPGVPRYPNLQSDGLVHVISCADLTSSHLSVSCGLPLDDAHLLRAVSLLGHLVSYTEGPLYSRIRGAGLAYNAWMSVSLWNGLASFELTDSTDPLCGWQHVQDLLVDLLSDEQIVDSLEAAKASYAYSHVGERATPAGLASLSLRQALRGLPLPGTPEERSWYEAVMQLTAADLRWVVEEWLIPRFQDPSRHVIIVATSPSLLGSLKLPAHQLHTF